MGNAFGGGNNPFNPKPYDPNMGGTPELYDQFNRANNRMTMEVRPTDGMTFQEYVNYNNMPTEQREAYSVNRMQNRFDNFPGFGIDDMQQKILPDVDPGIPNQQPPSSDKPGNEQYFLQMRQSIDSLNEAMKQIQGMQTPGGQYSGGGMMKPGGFIANTDNAVGK